MAYINLDDTTETSCISSLTSILSLGTFCLTKFLSIKRLCQRQLFRLRIRQAELFWSRFKESGNEKDLDLAIYYRQATLDYCPNDPCYRSAALRRLADLLCKRYELRQETDDLDRAIMLDRTALKLLQGSYHSTVLADLACILTIRFKRSRKYEDLEEAITLERTVLELRPEGHPRRSLALANLTHSLWLSFEHSGKVKDLEEVISMHRAALNLLPEDHPDRSSSSADLAFFLTTRFEQSGRKEDLEEAISMERTVLELQAEGHPRRSSALANLAHSLWLRFKHSARMEDLEEAISMERAALNLRPKDHPDHFLSFAKLSFFLSERSEQSGRIEDLEEAISMGRALLEIEPEDHLDRSWSVSILASSLRMRYQHSKRMEDLEEATLLHRAALELRPKGHPRHSSSLANLAICLLLHFEYGERMEDLEEAILLYRKALKLQREDHLGYSSWLINLARCLWTRFRHSGNIEDLEEAIRSLRLATSHPFSDFAARLDAAYSWTVMAQFHDHNTLIEAHRAATSVLQRALTTRPTLSEQHKFLRKHGSYQSVTLDVASHVIGKGEFNSAVELLEQGRALLWSQLHGFRASLEQLLTVDRTLAKIFEVCSRRLEALVTSSERTTGSSTSAFEMPEHNESNKQRSIDEALAQMRRLSEEQEDIISDIRRLPEFKDFLRPKPFSDIQQAAVEGPIIVLNHSQYRCDALIILSCKNEPCVCVPLDNDFYSDTINLHEELIRIRRTLGVGSGDYDEVLRRIMQTLWDRVVSKVVQKLKELGIDKGSRIWWCPTSVLSAFPFHAAGPYKASHGSMKYLLDDYTSSYTPTLTSLINARSGAEIGVKRILLVADTKLPSAEKERKAISRIRCCNLLLDDSATPEAVLKHLQKARWVHFVCHGQLGDEPFNACLKLPGGELTLLEIARANLPNAEFAFLSACHTAEQSPDCALDEALHLSAGMQFCGFRSVVGTMWKLLDKDGPFLSRAVYRHLMGELEEGEIRFKRAAEAVRQAALALRESGDMGIEQGADIEAERWVNLVHIGA